MKKIVSLVALLALAGVAAQAVDIQCTANEKCGADDVVLHYKYVENTCNPAQLDVVACPTCDCGTAASLNCPKGTCGPQACNPCGFKPIVGTCNAKKAKTTKCPWYRINKAWARGLDNIAASPADVTQQAFMSSASIPVLGFVWGAAEGLFIGVFRCFSGVFDCLTFGVADDLFYDNLGLVPVWHVDNWYKLPPVFGSKCDKPKCPEK